MSAIVTTYQEFQEGKRAEPAYSQVSRTANAEDQTMQAIAAAEQELCEQGIDKSAFQNHRGLIKEWLETVILSADEEGDQDDGKAAVMPPSDPGGPESPHTSKQMPIREETQTRYPAKTLPDPDVANTDPLPPHLVPKPTSMKRSSSMSTHRSQESTWRPREASQTDDYPILMISKVLRSKYAPSTGGEPFTLPLKRAFNALDPTNRGWLARKTVEQNLSGTASRLGVPLKDGTLAAMIKSEDEKEGKSDYRIDVDEFINIALQLRQYVCSTNERLSRARGLQLAVAHVLSWQNGLEVKAISGLWELRPGNYYQRSGIPYPYKLQGYGWGFSRAYPPVYEHRFGGPLKNGGFPLSQNITNALYLATNFCVDGINFTLSEWQKKLEDSPSEIKSEIFAPLDMSLEVATLFHRYVADNETRGLHWLDEFTEMASLVPLSIYEDLRECPLRLAVDLRKRLWNVLASLLGIMSELSDCRQLLPDNTPENPAAIFKWREKRIFERAGILHDSALEDLNNKAASEFEAIQSWVRQSNSLRDRWAACTHGTATLRRAQELKLESLRPWLLTISFSLGPVPRTSFRKFR